MLVLWLEEDEVESFLLVRTSIIYFVEQPDVQDVHQRMEATPPLQAGIRMKVKGGGHLAVPG